MNCDKTIDFMRGLKRMCAGVNYKCINCPIEYTEFCERLIYSYVADDFEPEIFQEEIIDKIQKWNDEHPQKTYADVFLRSFRTQIEEPTKFRLYAAEVYMEANAIKGNNALIAGTSLWRNEHD